MKHIYYEGLSLEGFTLSYDEYVEVYYNIIILVTMGFNKL